MLENFQLVAILKTTGGQTRLLQIPLHQGLQNKLAESWQVQHDEFVNNVDEIDFDAGYTPEEHERFRLREYELPEWIIEKNSHTVRDLDPISAHEDLMGSIKGLAAFARNDQGEEIILFQNFSPSHVIRPGRFLFLQNDTYETAQHPGITLDSKLSALYLSAERKLLFNNLRTVNTFLPLAEFYKESSEQGIHETLSHNLLAPEDSGALARGANQWFRKRFAMLRDSGILDQYSAQQIVDHSTGYELDIELDGDKIVFPSDKAAAKRLLQFLNEEIFRGAITETLYETNSKRQADPTSESPSD